MMVILKKLYLLLFILFLAGNTLLAEEVSSCKNLMPAPAEVQKRSGRFT